ncbi:MAG TPA: DNA repair protein RecN [Thermodesulfovibrionales bacterium]|nr:DNA repair protein RecN [Thermodesulfovibrionales bacterium]
MLRELYIRNLAIIDDLSVRFEDGLNVLTGETGAGKSIIVDALGLALGDRAQGDMIKAGEKEAVIQAFFEVGNDHALPETGIDIADGIMMRRVISSSGKSRAYINDVMVTLQTLAETGKALVDIHSQHEHQSLLLPEKQRLIIDSYGRHYDELERVHELYAVTASLREEFNDLSQRIKERAHRIDLLTFQINEIDSASLKSDEKASLEEERRILLNLNKLKEATETAYSLLYEGNGACTESLAMVISRLRDIRAFDPGVGNTLAMLESAMPLLEDAAIELRNYRGKYDLDPQRIEEVEDRIDLIRRLEKKYGNSSEDILAYRNSAAAELTELQESDERLQSVEEAFRKQSEELLHAAQILSDKRKKTARKVEDLIEKNLKDLAFMHAQFRINIVQDTDAEKEYRITTNGFDRIEFLFSANAGEPLKPLSKVASGGELSRVMLALKSILADVDCVPVLIFDEVDAGIGGRTAESVGKKLLKVSESHQLLCITHLPQIASLARHHLRIEKAQKNAGVRVVVHELSGVERQEEIARMLSGTVTAISRRHAEELLERTK